MGRVMESGGEANMEAGVWQHSTEGELIFMDRAGKSTKHFMHTIAENLKVTIRESCMGRLLQDMYTS
jgi:hypothetical protein